MRLERPNRASGSAHPEGRAGHTRSDNGPEFAVAKTSYIGQGSSSENGFVERFNARRGIFYLREVRS